MLGTSLQPKCDGDGVCCPNMVPLKRSDSVSTADTQDPSDGEEDTGATLTRSESVNTVYSWPVYEMRTMALPIALTSMTGSSNSIHSPLCRTDSNNSRRKLMCRTLRAESECRERLEELLADEETTTNSSDWTEASDSDDD